MPGTEARFAVTVSMSTAYSLSGSSIFSPMGKAGTGDVGQITTSTSRKTASKSSRMRCDAKLSLGLDSTRDVPAHLGIHSLGEVLLGDADLEPAGTAFDFIRVARDRPIHRRRVHVVPAGNDLQSQRAPGGIGLKHADLVERAREGEKPKARNAAVARL